MRGKVGGRSRFSDDAGITPAYAGKSKVDTAGVVSFRDHPRLCGEKPFLFFGFSLSEGSPPPMRGKDLYFTRERILQGITPAYAGKSGRVCGLKICRRDHPRLCGEKGLQTGDTAAVQGSPPPMRGKVHDFRYTGRRRRITPAYAGKRSFRAFVCLFN